MKKVLELRLRIPCEGTPYPTVMAMQQYLMALFEAQGVVSIPYTKRAWPGPDQSLEMTADMRAARVLFDTGRRTKPEPAE